MIGLIIKDFLVFKKRFSLVYRLIGVVVLGAAVMLFPNEGVKYIALLLPMMGVAFLTEIIKVEEKSDWRDYLPALPITSREIVLSRYVFCGILLAVFTALSFFLCIIATVIGGFTLSTVMPDFVIGVWYAVLMVCFGIPGGYFFKNDMCTGAMIGSCFVIMVLRSIGADTLLFSLGSSVACIIMIILAAMIVFISYRIALWIYSTKRYAKARSGEAKAI